MIKLSEKEKTVLGQDLNDPKEIISAVNKKMASLREIEVRAKLMGFELPSINERQKSILYSLSNRIRKRFFPTQNDEYTDNKHEEQESKYPKHQLEFIREITKESGSSWVTVISSEPKSTKKLYQCKVCQGFYNTKSPYYNCRGEFVLGEPRETPYIKPDQTFSYCDDYWKVTQFYENRMAIIPQTLSNMFDSYLDIGREYFLEQLCKYDHWELWEITAPQMKRETSQVLLAIEEDGRPTLDLDS